ncbi:hypothetical protein PTSG_00393 [Salpingoeca rosetta]|uniref:Kinesin motor domain-containing protein n=1 Tax=Salpingoeca rosetta (strain ATCC 50818 / BSB-021) TaxID=946362 RepID=F2TWC7_SALR5|nr:uncharacterized protein PTSG_00393 [Salpingoeca rosetta]EGD72373.1 hypothetical protein PTSG_00393 [Salpingoeca rosetta]|eukprot:XP_004998942.1 hypothetical protein PTSG_00393 [Salpingoeca rosetta]
MSSTAKSATTTPRAKVVSKTTTRPTFATPRSATKTRTTKKSTTPGHKKGTGKQRVTRHVDQRVQARNSALNAFGGVKVDVFVRVRPRLELESGQEECVSVDPEENTLELRDPAGNPATYTYDKVYGPSSSQSDVYDDCVSPIVEQVCRGMNCCIFAYGQTGAGKTFTMRGDLSSNENQHGIIQRSLSHLLRRLHEHEYTDIKVKCSFLEIYNEELEDLFDAKSKPSTRKRSTRTTNNLVLVDDEKRGCVCKGLKEMAVESVPQVMSLLEAAEAKARYSETKMNKLSNRAHRIFTLIVDFKRYEKPVQATLTFVDLAGSEDISKSGATGLTAREASHINKSLLTLGRVINALACNERHIPYRDSKLTRLLSEALGGVCKTSFIACVSPCSGSNTETSSTLRYAERAMEALNISQLPRWKQDEIMIDGLTRRVQQLVDDLESMRKMHKEEMQELKSERDHLLEENVQHKRDLGRAHRKIDRLLARKAELKSGVNLLTGQKADLISEKEALQKELLETRMDRDGLRADRNTMEVVLKSVRDMRNRLLDAHSATEKSLTSDALALKKVIEGAVVDIDELHQEIARKKSLSVHNEQTADAYLERLSAHLRDIIQEVQDFQGMQDTQHSGLQSMLSELRGTRQRETAALTNDINRVATGIVSVFKDLVQQAEDVETARKARISRGREDATLQTQHMQAALEKAQVAVVGQLGELRKHCDALGASMNGWAERANQQAGDLLTASKGFTTEVKGKLRGFEEHMVNATNAHVNQLEAHHAALVSFLTEEKAKLEAQSEQVIEDIAAFVSRQVRDYATQAQRRAETAVNGFKDRTSTMTDDVRELANAQGAQLRVLNEAVAGNDAAVEEGVKAARTTTARQLATAQGILDNVRSASADTEAELTTHVDGMAQTATHHKEQRLKFLGEDEQAAQAARAASERVYKKGIKEMQTEGEALRGSVAQHLQAFTAATDDLSTNLAETRTSVREHVEAAQEQLYDTEADGANYVMQEIKRDTKEAPPHKAYTYPQDYAATPAYGAVLENVKPDWTREEGIMEGQVKPGRGTDFAGEKGDEDHSGVLTSTLPKPLEAPEQQRLDRAVYESDAGEYEDPEGFVDPIDRDSEDEEEDDDDDAAAAAESEHQDSTAQDGDVQASTGGADEQQQEDAHTNGAANVQTPDAV